MAKLLPNQEFPAWTRPSACPTLLAEIPDPRRAEGRRHPLRAVLPLVALATMAGMRGLHGAVDFGRNLPPDVVASLGFTRPEALAESTPSEILRAIDVDAFGAAVGRWSRRQADRHGRTAIAIDGKSPRGSTGGRLPAVHPVAACAHEARVVLAELRVDAKTDEHKAALELPGMLPLEGAVVTADAMFTRADLCREVRDGGGDDLLAVKENRPAPLRDIEAIFAAGAGCSPLSTAPA